MEYQVRDRLSFSRFLGLAIEDSIPDATTLWLFREKVARAGLIEQRFDRFDQHLAAKGYMAGRSIDASIVLVPTQRNRTYVSKSQTSFPDATKPTQAAAISKTQITSLINTMGIRKMPPRIFSCPRTGSP